MTVKKICFKCGIEKPLIDFYKHSAMKDGYLNKCKECSKKDVSKNRIKNVDYYREYDRNRPNKTERIQQRKIYKEKMKKLEPEKFNEIFRVTSKRWSLKNKLKKNCTW